MAVYFNSLNSLHYGGPFAPCKDFILKRNIPRIFSKVIFFVKNISQNICLYLKKIISTEKETIFYQKNIMTNFFFIAESNFANEVFPIEVCVLKYIGQFISYMFVFTVISCLINHR